MRPNLPKWRLVIRLKRGRIILVQDPGEAEYGSMPRSAIATGLADFVLPLAEVGRNLLDLARSKSHVGEALELDEQVHVRQILDQVRASSWSTS